MKNFRISYFGFRISVNVWNLKFSIWDLFSISNFGFRIFVILFLFFFAWQAQAAVINRAPTSAIGLVGYWTFDGKTMGTTSANDLSGNANTGYLINGPYRTAGKLGQALNFDGSNDYVDTTITNGVAGLVNNGNYTACVWALTRTPATRLTILGDWNTNGANESVAIEFGGYTTPAGEISVNQRRTAGNSSLSTGVIYSTNRWYHVCSTWDGSTLRSYVDGIFRTSSSVSDMLNGSDLTFGRAGAFNGQYLNGLIDEVRVYNRALSPDEVRGLYNLGR